MIKNNKIYNENCLDTMSRMDDNVIDLTVTSPPYDGLRTYNGYSFDFESIAKELFRVTKEGGVVVWIVGDATINGSETGTSFKQALFFKECGFNLNDTMIWNKGCFSAVGALKARYAPVFEYMFVFSKGKSKTFKPLKDRVNKTFMERGNYKNYGTIRQKDGTTKKKSDVSKTLKKYGQRFNIWNIPPYTGGNVKTRLKHPAIFPEQLANDHIITWTNEKDLVYDPFMGSGTTAKMAKNNNRNYIGSEISKEYCNIITERLNTLL